MAAGVLGALSTALPYLSAAWQVGSQYLNKPKKEDYVPTGSMYQRYLAHLKSKTSESTVYHQRMRPALRQIGQQTQRGQRQVGYQVARQKPGGGIEAQMRMGINQQALEAIGIASEKASVAQERVNERTGEQLLRIGVREEQALQRYGQAKRQWTKDMFRTGAQVGINLASTAVQKHIADTKLKLDAAKDAKETADAFTASYESAKADLTIPKETTIEQYQDMIDTSEYEDPNMMNKYLKNRRAQDVKDVKFQKDVEIEKFEGGSFEVLRQFTEHLETLDDPKQAYAELDKVKDFMTLKDKNKALTKVESTFPDLVYDDPLERKIAVAETAGDRGSAKRNLAEAVTAGTIDQIKKAGSAVNAIDSRKFTEDTRRYTQETRQTAKDKKVYDAKALESTLNNNIASTIEYLGLYDRTYSTDIEEPQIGKVGETTAPLKKALEKIERDRAFKELIQTFEGVNFKDGKGMTDKEAKGLKKQAVKYVSLIDVDSEEEKNLLKFAVSKFDADEVMRLSQSFTGLDAKNAATFTLEIMKRIDFLFNKMPYVNNGVDNSDPLGLF